MTCSILCVRLLWDSTTIIHNTRLFWSSVVPTRIAIEAWRLLLHSLAERVRRIGTRDGTRWQRTADYLSTSISSTHPPHSFPLCGFHNDGAKAIQLRGIWRTHWTRHLLHSVYRRQWSGVVQPTIVPVLLPFIRCSRFFKRIQIDHCHYRITRNQTIDNQQKPQRRLNYFKRGYSIVAMGNVDVRLEPKHTQIRGKYWTFSFVEYNRLFQFVSELCFNCVLLVEFFL